MDALHPVASGERLDDDLVFLGVDQLDAEGHRHHALGGIASDPGTSIGLHEVVVGLGLGLDGVALDVGLERVGVDKALDGVDLLLGGFAS